MAKRVARIASLYIADSSSTLRALSAYMNNITFNQSAENPDSTGFGQDNRERLPDAIKDYTLTFRAFLATGANETDVVLSGILGGSTGFKFGPAGSANGEVLYTACAILTEYNIELALADAALVSGTLVNRSGSLTRTTWS